MGSGRNSKTRTALRAVIFVLIAVLGIGLISPAFVVNNEWDMRHVHGFFLEPEDSLDVVLIGASQLYTGYSAPLAWRDYGFTSYPLAVSNIPARLYGSLLTEAVNRQHPKLIVVDIDEPKLEAALQNGATDVINSKTEDVVTRAKELTDGYGPTVVIDCACFHGSFLTACKAAGNASRVITMGFSIAPDEINQFVITSKELDVRGSRLQNHRFQTVIDLINKGKIDLNGSISHTFKLTDAQAAFDFNDTHDPSIRKIALLND